MKRNLWKLASLACAVMMLFTLMSGWVAAEEKAEAAVVKNYQELLDQINNNGASRVLISKKYKQGGHEGENIIPRAGETITIASETGEPLTVTGRFDIMGEGTVIFENISVQAHPGHPALWIGSGATVAVDDLTAGKAKTDYGLPAAIVKDARLTVGSAKGSDGKAGVGGDGIYAVGSSVVEVGTATGGNAPKGIGGSGVIAFGGAEVKVTGNAKGGDGLYAAGKGTLAGWNTQITVDGTAEDGLLLEGKKTLDPEKITNRMLLENALRSGAAEIVIDEKFKAGGDLDDEQCWFMGAETMKLTGGAEGKNTVMDCQVRADAGTWMIEGIDIVLNTKDGLAALQASGNAKVNMTGNLNAKGKNDGSIRAYGNAQVMLTGNDNGQLYAAENAVVEMTGDIEHTNKNYPPVYTRGSGTVRVKGNLTLAVDTNAINNHGGTIEITGEVIGRKNNRYPLIFSDDGTTHITGPVTLTSNCEIVYNRNGGDVLIEGDVTSTATKNYAIWIDENGGSVTIKGNLTTRYTAAMIKANMLNVDGNILVESKKTIDTFKVEGSGGIKATGWIRCEPPAK